MKIRALGRPTTVATRSAGTPPPDWNTLMKSALPLIPIIAAAVSGEPAFAQEKPRVAIIGTGTLAGALGPALGQRGYPVTYGSREPDRESVRTLVTRTGSNATAIGQRDAAAQGQRSRPLGCWSASLLSCIRRLQRYELDPGTAGTQ